MPGKSALSDRKAVLAENLRQHLAAIVESSNDAIISKDLQGVISSWNRAAERLFGYSPEEAIGQSILILVPEDRVEEQADIIRRVHLGERVEHYETVRRRKDGSFIDLSITVSPVKDSEGRVVGASNIARDISDRKHAQRQELLIAEMRHRTRNFIAIVDALARQSRPADPVASQCIDQFVGRLRALLAASEIVENSPGGKASLDGLFRQTLRPFVDPDRTNVRIDGPLVDVEETTAGNLTLAIHELATNALKYGALKSGSGKISLTWVREAGRRVVVEWKEVCDAPLPARPGKTGFGTRVIQSAVAQSKGNATVLFEPDGLRCRFEFQNG